MYKTTHKVFSSSDQTKEKNKNTKPLKKTQSQTEESQLKKQETLNSSITESFTKTQADFIREPAKKSSKIFKAKAIKKIEIKGNEFVSEEFIRSHLKVKVGDRINDSKVQEDVRNLFSLGFFEDIKVTAKTDKKRNVIVTYTFKERVFVSVLEFKGNKKLNDKDLKEGAFVEEHSFLNPHQLKRTIEDIIKQYKEKGYYLAKLSHHLEPDKDNSKAKKLVITIKENKKLSIKQIQFIGNRNVPSERLKAFMKLKEKNLLSFLTSGAVYQADFLDHDKQVIEYYYRNLGYLNVQVQTPVLNITADKRHLFLTFEISEGVRYKMGDYIFEDKALRDKKASFKLTGKEFFSLGDLQQDIQKISQFYKNKGYALVQVEPLFYPDKLEEDKIHLGFKIDKGEIYKVGRINIKGNKTVRDKVVFRRFQIKEGEIYNQDQIDLTKQLLEQLAVFEKVNISPGLAHSKELQLDTMIKERENTGEASLVGGYNSYTRLFIQGGLKKDNFLGLEQNVSVRVNIGYYDETMIFYYQNPYFLDTRWNFGFELFNIGQQSYVGSQFSSLGNLFGGNDYRTYFSLDSGFSFSLGRKFNVFSSLFLKYRFSNQRISEDAIYLIRRLPGFSSLFRNRELTEPTAVRSALSNSNLSIENLTQFRFNDIYNFDSATGLKSSLSFIAEQDKRNDRFYATDGFWTRLQAEYTGLGGDFQYSKLLLDVRHYYQPLWKFVLKNRLDLGYVFSNIKDQEVPFTELFLLGGPYNLRGFLTHSQGPRKRSEEAYRSALAYNENLSDTESKIKNPESFALRPYGGAQKLFYSLELEAPVLERAGLRVATFLDIGEANDRLAFDLNKQLRANVGVGLRWISPFGPLSLDWAVPYRPRERFEEKAWQFQFSVGSVL